MTRLITRFQNPSGPITWRRIKSIPGNIIRNALDVATGKPIRDFAFGKINNAIATNPNLRDSRLRHITYGLEFLGGGWADALRARARAGMEELIPGWTYEKSDEVGKGYPVITVDKGNHLARFYNSEGELEQASAAGTGFNGTVSEKVNNDNRTPTGVYKLSSPESGPNKKKNGAMSFGPWFYRTSHRYKSGSISGIGIHGTGKPIRNGTNVSHGCIRVDNDAIERFHDTAPNKGAGTTIAIYEKNGGTLY